MSHYLSWIKDTELGNLLKQAGVTRNHARSARITRRFGPSDVPTQNSTPALSPPQDPEDSSNGLLRPDQSDVKTSIAVQTRSPSGNLTSVTISARSQNDPPPSSAPYPAHRPNDPLDPPTRPDLSAHASQHALRAHAPSLPQFPSSHPSFSAFPPVQRSAIPSRGAFPAHHPPQSSSSVPAYVAPQLPPVYSNYAPSFEPIHSQNTILARNHPAQPTVAPKDVGLSQSQELKGVFSEVAPWPEEYHLHDRLDEDSIDSSLSDELDEEPIFFGVPKIPLEDEDPQHLNPDPYESIDDPVALTADNLSPDELALFAAHDNALTPHDEPPSEDLERPPLNNPSSLASQDAVPSSSSHPLHLDPGPDSAEDIPPLTSPLSSLFATLPPPNQEHTEPDLDPPALYQYDEDSAEPDVSNPSDASIEFPSTLAPKPSPSSPPSEPPQGMEDTLRHLALLLKEDREHTTPQPEPTPEPASYPTVHADHLPLATTNTPQSSLARPTHRTHSRLEASSIGETLRNMARHLTAITQAKAVFFSDTQGLPIAAYRASEDLMAIVPIMRNALNSLHTWGLSQPLQSIILPLADSQVLSLYWVPVSERTTIVVGVVHILSIADSMHATILNMIGGSFGARWNL